MSFQNSKLTNGINVVTFNMPYVNSVSINIIVIIMIKQITIKISLIQTFLICQQSNVTAFHQISNIAIVLLLIFNKLIRK